MSEVYRLALLEAAQLLTDRAAEMRSSVPAARDSLDAYLDAAAMVRHCAEMVLS